MRAYISKLVFVQFNTIYFESEQYKILQTLTFFLSTHSFTACVKFLDLGPLSSHRTGRKALLGKSTSFDRGDEG